MPPYDSSAAPLSATPRDSRLRIDGKLSVAWILGAIGAVALPFVAQYYQVGQLVKDVGSMQATLVTMSAQVNDLKNEVNLLRWRVDAMERNLAVPLQPGGPSRR